MTLGRTGGAETPAPEIRSLAAATPAVYAGTAGGGLLRSGDGGISWAPVPEVICAGGVVSDVALGEDQKSVFVSCGDFKALAFDGSGWAVVAPGIPNNPVDPGPGRPRLHDDPLNDEKPTYLTGSSSFSYDTYLEYSWIKTGSSLAAGRPYRFGPLVPIRLLAPFSEFSPWAIWTRRSATIVSTTDVLRSLAREHSVFRPFVADEERIGTIPDDAVIAFLRERGRPERLVAGGRVGAWLSADEGQTWSLAFAGPVTAIAVDRTAPGRYAAAAARLRWTTDAGATWTDVPNAPPDVTALAFDEAEPTLLWIGRSDGSVSSARLLASFSSLAGRPTVISVKEDAGALAVRFTARADDAARIRVERRAYGSGDFTPIGTVTLFDPFRVGPQALAGVLRDSAAPPDTSLGYRAVAISSAGFESPSDEVFAVLPTTEPLAPGGLQSAPDGADLRLAWTDYSSREQGFVIQFLAQDGTFRPWAVVPANTTSYRVEASPLSPGFFRVGSFNARGRQEPTPASVAGGVPPGAPSLDGSAGPDANGLFVRTNDPYVDGGTLERSIDDGPFVSIATIPRSAPFVYSTDGLFHYTDGGLPPEHDVVYRARLSNLAGPGPYSASVSLGTFTSAPEAPPGVQASYVPGAAGAIGVLNVAWGGVAREDSFQLFDYPAWSYVGPYPTSFAAEPRNATSHSEVAFFDGDHDLWVRALNRAGFTDSARFRLHVFAGWAQSIAATTFSRALTLHLTPVVVRAGGLNGAFFTTSIGIVSSSRARILDTGSNTLLTADLNGPAVIPDAVDVLTRPFSGFPPGLFAGGLISHVPSGGGLNQIRVTTPVEMGGRVGRPGVVFNSVPIGRLPDSAVVLAGLRQDASFRSNVAIVHPGLTDEQLVLRLTVFDGATGRGVALPDVTLQRAEWMQIPAVLAAAGFPAPAQGWVVVERIEGSSRFFTYGVVNEMTTSDGSFVGPVSVGADGVPELVVPLVLETSELEAEISLANRGDSSLALTVDYLESIPVSGTFSSDLTLPAGRQVFLPGFVDGLRRSGAPLGARGALGRYGSLRIRRVDGRPLAGLTAAARLATRDGRFGTFVPTLAGGVGTEGTAVVGGSPQSDGTTMVSHVPATGSESADVFVLNAGPDTVSLCASPAAYALTVLPCYENQIRTLAPGGLLRIENPTAGTGVFVNMVVVQRVSGTGPLYAFGLLTDTVTRDPGFWEGSALTP